MEWSMTWEEIRRAYPDQWVIIEFQKLDDTLEVVDGHVIAAASTRDEIYRRVKTDGRGARRGNSLLWRSAARFRGDILAATFR